VKYFEIVDAAVGCLNFQIMNKAVPVLIATENLLGALNLQGIEFARKGGGNYKERNIQGKAPRFASV